PGAGWGIVDSRGQPKAAYYHLKRTWRNRQLTLTNEGLNGLHLHAINETAEACGGAIEVLLLKGPNVVIAKQEVKVHIAPRAQQLLRADEILGSFYDVNYAYRFGPPHHDVVVVTWYDEQRQVVSEAFHFVQRNVSNPAPAQLEAKAEWTGHGEYRVTLRSD